jgi:tRNA-specific 2-thiouridylase
MFPLGEISKSDARQAARDSQLAVAEKKESQEICFVPDGDYAGFIDRYLARRAADRSFAWRRRNRDERRNR